jgi:hypothetical protein
MKYEARNISDVSTQEAYTAITYLSNLVVKNVKKKYV